MCVPPLKQECSSSCEPLSNAVPIAHNRAQSRFSVAILLNTLPML
jgi:hypothetical protein